MFTLLSDYENFMKHFSLLNVKLAGKITSYLVSCNVSSSQSKDGFDLARCENILKQKKKKEAKFRQTLTCL